MRRIVFVVLGVASLTLTACGGSSAKTTTTTTAAAASGPAASLQAYRSCLSQHGVNLPARPAGQNATGGGSPGGQNPTQRPGGQGLRNTPLSLPPGVDQKTYDSARQACQSKLPQGGFGTGGGNGPAPAQFQAYLSCLKDHGVNVDPNGGRTALTNLDRTTDTFKTANQTCQALMPQRQGGGATTTTTAAAV